MSNHVRKGRSALKARRESADERAEARNGRTADEQLKLIEKRPGQSKRERAKIEGS